MKTLKEYDVEAEKLTSAINMLKEIRSRVWKKRDKLFCELEKWVL